MSMPSKPTTANILLVESEPLLLKFIRTILERAGLTVLSAGTAEEAIRIEQSFEGTIDLLITGVSMPGLSGPELAEHLERRSGLRVMLMSSGPLAPSLASSHGWHFIAKPFMHSALLDEISIALRSR